MTQAQTLVDVSQLASVSALGNRNVIVDGNFDSVISSSQALNNSTGSGVFTMYYCWSPGAATITSNAFAPGAASGYGMASCANNYLKFNQTTSAANGQVYQRIERASTFNGRSVTFSCWLWTDSGSVIIATVGTEQYFGTGGSPSTQVGTYVTVNWVVTTTPKRFSVRFDVPSVSGKIFGTNNNDFTSVLFSTPANTIFALNTTQWQLEQSYPGSSSDLNGAGGAPTMFEYRGAQAELARVSRYYQIINASARFFAGAASYLTDSTLNWPLMRGLPVASVITTGTLGNATIAASGLPYVINPSGGRFEIASVGAGDCYAINYVYALDARL